MPDYDEWNRAIAREFFSPEHDGRPAPLAVDTDALCAIADRLGIPKGPAVDQFLAAVNEHRPSGTGFYWFAREQRRWRESDRHLHVPPTIALLGLCVLAASQMERDLDAGIASHNYYARLNPLLGRPAGAGMPSSFAVVAGFWRDLSNWLDKDLVGVRGKSTIRPHYWHVNVGYPISQALLRRVDRHRLTDFFRSAGLRPGDEITADELWALLHIWIHEGCGLSSYGLHAIHAADGRLAGALSEIVKAEFDAWDGSLRDAEGHQVGAVALRMKARAGWRSVEMSLLPRRPEGFPTGKFTTTTGRHYKLTSKRGGWYDPLNLEVDARMLERGITLRHGPFTVRFQPGLVMPLRASIELGGWVTVPRLSPLEDHCLLVHDSKLEDVKRFLAKSGDGRHQVNQVAGLPSHWRVIRGVRVIEESEPRDPAVALVTPRVGMTARLEGGLEVAQAVFLTGGEPDLWVSASKGSHIEAEVDDVKQRWPGTVRRVELRELGLPIGDHRIDTAGRTFRFATSNGAPRGHQGNAGVLGYELQRHRQYRPSAASAVPLRAEPRRGEVRIVGAAALGASEDLPLPPEPPILLRHGFAGYTVLGARPGEVLCTREPPIPPWLEFGLKDSVCQFFDVPCPFEAEVVLMEGADRWLLRAVRHAPRPALRDGDALGIEAVETWREAVLAAYQSDVEVPTQLSHTWLTYIEAARGTSA